MGTLKEFGIVVVMFVVSMISVVGAFVVVLFGVVLLVSPDGGDNGKTPVEITCKWVRR